MLAPAFQVLGLQVLPPHLVLGIPAFQSSPDLSTWAAWAERHSACLISPLSSSAAERNMALAVQQNGV